MDWKSENIFNMSNLNHGTNQFYLNGDNLDMHKIIKEQYSGI